MNYTFKVIVLGDTGVGKSSILQRYTDDLFDLNTPSTIGVDFFTKKEIFEYKGKNIAVKLNIFDTAGHEAYRSITRSYYNLSHAVILVYDIARESSLRSVEYWLYDIRRYLDIDNLEIILVGNKTDLNFVLGRNSPRDFSLEKSKSSDNSTIYTIEDFSFEKSSQDIETQRNTFMNGNGIEQYLEVSSKTGENIDILFKTLAKKLVEKHPKPQLSEFRNTLSLPSRSLFGCCNPFKTRLGIV